MSADPKNLYQRIAQVSGEVGPIVATGRTPPRGDTPGQPTLSIADIEDRLGPLLAKCGLVTGYTWNAPPITVGQEGKLTVWQADLTIWMRNADRPDEFREDRVYDIGSSPSAAVSFALKRYYRALFHLADAEDETRPTRVVPTGQKPAKEPAAKKDGKPEAVMVSPSRKEAMTRLSRAFMASGLSSQQVQEKSKALFGKTNSHDMTEAELTQLSEELEGLVLTKNGDMTTPSA